MIARRTFAAAALALSVLGCDGVLGLRPMANDPDAGATVLGGAGGRGGAGDGAGGTAGRIARGGTTGSAATGGRCTLPGLLAYYPFDGDTADHTGGGHDIVATDVLTAPGKIGNAFAFRGTASAMRVMGDATSRLGARTLCAWVFPESVTGLAQPLFANGSEGQGDVLSLTSSTPTSCGTLEGQPFLDHTGQACLVGLGLSAPSDSWSFVCYAFDGLGRELFYANGHTAAGATANYASLISSLTIGSSSIGGSTTGPAFRGVIDEVTVWDRGLSAQELLALQNEGLSCSQKKGGTAGSPGTGATGGAGSCLEPPVVSLRSVMAGGPAPLMAGTTADFDLSVTNANSTACAAKTFQVLPNVPYPLAASGPVASVRLGGGQTVLSRIQITSAVDAQSGNYAFSCDVVDIDGVALPATAWARYIVGPRSSTGIPLVADGDGQYDGTNAAGVVGYWWSTGDDYGLDWVLGNGQCRAAGFPAESCSVLTTPTPGTFFRPDPGGRGMCMSGVSAKVIPDATGALAYAAIWGNMMGFELNDPGTFADGATMRMPYDAPAHGITGFAFDIDAVPGRNLNVAFQTVGTENNSPYWMGATSDRSPILQPGHYEIRWREVGGPIYLPSPPPFDPTQLEAIQFHVVSNTSAPVPFDFCVNNLMMLTN